MALAIVLVASVFYVLCISSDRVFLALISAGFIGFFWNSAVNMRSRWQEMVAGIIYTVILAMLGILLSKVLYKPGKDGEQNKQ